MVTAVMTMALYVLLSEVYLILNYVTILSFYKKLKKFPELLIKIIIYTIKLHNIHPSNKTSN